MTGHIYYQNENCDLIPMSESSYDSEKILQEILSKHPDLLAGEQINSDNPRRWLLVTREMAVKGEDEGATRWSLDHLFLDQDAVPTLVEVKRGERSGIRRKVVGQMLDYAANAVVTWEVEKIRSAFERRCRREEKVPEKELFNLLGNEKNIDEFWLQVKTNLRAGRIRIIFLADSIPAELRRIVEFLNAQMDPAEVLAIEVKQFTSVNSGMKTYVPRVFGQTETARQNKLRGTKTGIQWNEATFMAALEDRSGAASRQVAENILLWIKPLLALGFH